MVKIFKKLNWIKGLFYLANVFLLSLNSYILIMDILNWNREVIYVFYETLNSSLRGKGDSTIAFFVPARIDGLILAIVYVSFLFTVLTFNVIFFKLARKEESSEEWRRIGEYAKKYSVLHFIFGVLSLLAVAGTEVFLVTAFIQITELIF